MQRGLRSNPRQGSVVVMTALGLVFLMGLVAMVTDVGWMYFQKARLQSSVNAAWKSGFDEANRLRAINNGDPLNSTDENKVRARIKDTFIRNGYTQAEADALNISFSGAATYSGHLEVSSNKSFPLFFASVLNAGNASVNSNRGDNLLESGTLDDGTGGGGGLVPLGIMHGDVIYGTISGGGGKGKLAVPDQTGYFYKEFGPGEGFTVGQEYILRLGAQRAGGADPISVPPGYDEFLTGGGNSNEGSLRFPNGNGASVWESNYKYGYPGSINVGDIVDTKPGGMAGPTNDARQYRIDQNRTRVVVPIIEVVGQDNTIWNQSGTTPVRVTGFAVFELTPPNEGDGRYGLGDYESMQIRGEFVKYIVNPNDVAAGS